MTAEASEAGPQAGSPPPTASDRCSIALLTYKGNPFCGGQGVYVRHLSRELARLGHRVEVIGSQPYPVLDRRARATASTPHRAAQPRPLPPARPLPHPGARRVPRLDRRARGRHHVDRRLPRAAHLQPARPAPSAPPAAASSTSSTTTRRSATACWATSASRWSPRSTTPSPSTGSWTWTPPTALAAPRCRYAAGTASPGCRSGWPAACRRCSPSPAPPARRSSTTSACGRSRIHVVHIGADTDLFSPDPAVRRGARAGSSPPPARTCRSRAWCYLVEALAKVRTEHPDAHLVVVGKRAEDGPGRPGHRAVRPRRRRRVRQGHLATPNSSTWCARREVACVPSLYEGFSLPAAEAMATGTPLVATTGGAIPEVAGPDGETCLAVPPGDAGRAGRRPATGSSATRNCGRRLGAGGPRAGTGPLHLGPGRRGHGRAATARRSRRAGAPTRPAARPRDAPTAHVRTRPRT